MQFPTILGAVVPIVNISGVKPGEMKLTGSVLADIYLGKITKWSDPEIKKLNPKMNLPDTTITVVHRSDGSGTTFVFTNYLNKVNPDWAKVGSDVSVSWPVGLGGKGNEGVAGAVKQTPNSIGYVEYAYALANKLSHTLLQNKANVFASPSVEGIKSAAAYADWKNPTSMLTDEPGEKSWPITASTFILLHTNVPDDKKENIKQVLDFFDWAYHNGAKEAASLNYVMLPDEVIKSIEENWKATIKDSKGNPVWNK
jgi:phosphate transport system substrate-binding protein